MWHGNRLCSCISFDSLSFLDAFPGSVRKVHFGSHCYTFHFPSFRDLRSWREAQTLCRESGKNLVIIRDEEENAFLACKALEMQNKAMVKVDLHKIKQLLKFLICFILSNLFCAIDVMFREQSSDKLVINWWWSGRLVFSNGQQWWFYCLPSRCLSCRWLAHVDWTALWYCMEVEWLFIPSLFPLASRLSCFFEPVYFWAPHFYGLGRVLQMCSKLCFSVSGSLIGCDRTP